jgi:hypothetical protein
VTPAVVAALAESEAAQSQDNDSAADEQDGPAAGARIISDYIASLRSSRAADRGLLAVHAAACTGHTHSTSSTDQHTTQSAAGMSLHTETVKLRLVHAVTGAAAAEYTLDVRTLERLIAVTEESDEHSASVLMNMLRPPSSWSAPVQSGCIELKFDGECALHVLATNVCIRCCGRCGYELFCSINVHNH